MRQDAGAERLAGAESDFDRKRGIVVSMRRAWWLAGLVGALLGECIAGFGAWAIFVVRRASVRREVTAVLMEKVASGGRRALVVACMAAAALAVGGCSSEESTAKATDTRPPPISLERLEFDKAAFTVNETLFTQVYGASSPPLDFLEATILEVDPDAGRDILWTIGELITP